MGGGKEEGKKEKSSLSVTLGDFLENMSVGGERFELSRPVLNQGRQVLPQAQALESVTPTILRCAHQRGQVDVPPGSHVLSPKHDRGTCNPGAAHFSDPGLAARVCGCGHPAAAVHP